MLDKHLRPTLDKVLEPLAQDIAATNVTPDQITLAGALLVVLILLFGWLEWYFVMLAAILANRLLDGLDGALARAKNTSTARGGVLDITCDYVFYAGVPLAFALADPANLLPALALVAAFYINAGSFLGTAIVHAKGGKTPSNAQGEKSFHHASGLLEGTETILFFAAMCLLPSWFPALAWIFAVLTLYTAVVRLMGKSG